MQRAKVANLEKHVQDYDEKLAKILNENNESLSQIKTKLLAEKRQKEDIETDMAKMKNLFEKIMEDNERLRKETELRELQQKLGQQRHDEDEHFDKENITGKCKLIDELQAEKVRILFIFC